MKRILLAAMLAVFAHVPAAVAQIVLLHEDFEDVTLIDPIDEATTGTNVVSINPPTGWTVDRSLVPGHNSPDEDLDGYPDDDGITDFSGWTFVDRDWWFTVDGQQRDEFQLGSGVIAVADSDEWDDDGFLSPTDADPRDPHPRQMGDQYTTFLKRNVTALGNYPANRLRLKFDSSWRPEFDTDWPEATPVGQEAVVKVSFDGGQPVELFRWQSDPASPLYKPDATNEQIIMDIDNPAGFNTMELTFGYENAQNDWWWAVDNVTVDIPALPAVIQVNTATGEVRLKGGDFIEDSLTSYEIVSTSGSLIPAALNGLDAKNLDPTDGPIDLDTTPGNGVGETWDVVLAANDYISEAFLFGNSVFDEDRVVSLGQIYNTSFGQDPNLKFRYTNPTGIITEGQVEFVTSPLLAGDYNRDGTVNAADYTVWRDTRGAVGAGLLADGNGDQVVNDADYTFWKQRFGNTAGAGAGVAAVPEPAVWLILAGLAPGCLSRSRQRQERAAR